MNKSILSQAWELKAKLAETQKELSNIIVEANSGKGAVKVTINGQQKNTVGENITRSNKP